MKRFLFLICSLNLISNSFSQKVPSTFDTLNDVIIADYRKTFEAGFTNVIDSIESAYGLLSTTSFENISSETRDSLIGRSFSQFFIETYNSYKSNPDMTKLKKGKYSVFANFCYDQSGITDYVFYNWNQKRSVPDELDTFLRDFMTGYEFKGIPTGEKYCQCGSYGFRIKNKRRNTD